MSIPPCGHRAHVGTCPDCQRAALALRARREAEASWIAAQSEAEGRAAVSRFAGPMPAWVGRMRSLPTL